MGSGFVRVLCYHNVSMAAHMYPGSVDTVILFMSGWGSWVVTLVDRLVLWAQRVVYCHVVVLLG